MSDPTWTADGNGTAPLSLEGVMGVPAEAPHAPVPPPRTAPAAEGIETRLFRAGYLTADQLSELVRSHVETQRPFEQLIAERGLVTQPVLDAMLGHFGAAASETHAVLDVPLSTAPSLQAPIHEPTFTPEDVASERRSAPEAFRAQVQIPVPTPDRHPHSPQPMDTPTVDGEHVTTATPPSVDEPTPPSRPDDLAAEAGPTEQTIHSSVPTAPSVSEADVRDTHGVVETLAFDVIVRLQGGHELVTETHSTHSAAHAAAERVVRAAADDSDAGWFEIDGRWIRAEAAVAVELRARLV
jgi:hypothetical protein